MNVIEKETIKETYTEAVNQLLSQKEMIGNTKELNNCCIIVHNPTTKDLCFGKRKPSLKYLNAELNWYWSGDNSCKEIGKYASMWLKLTDDGKTSNSAYGYILFKKYGFNQLEQIIELLKKDKNSRRAVLNISDPTLNRITTKDMQCTMSIQFLVRNNELQETVYMRSNDIYFGFPYDYVFFVSLGEYVAKKLNLKLGLYTHHATSLHMYERDFNKFDIDLDEKINLNIEKIVEEHYEK